MEEAKLVTPLDSGEHNSADQKHRDKCTICQSKVSHHTTSASKSFIRRFVITEKAPTLAFSWLKAATTAFTFKTLLRHYAKRALTP